MKNRPVIIAVCGKGGVGKTCISALIVKALSENTSARILAIDADPAVGLSYPLGITVKKSVDDVRTDLIKRLENGEGAGREELVKTLEYELFNAIEEQDNLAFLAIGRPEGDGCYCQVNTLLKDIITEISGNFDYVIIDAEAGVEQISRRVMTMVNRLILVSDTSLKGLNVIETINRVAEEKCAIEKTGLIINRAKNQEEINRVCLKTDISTIGAILETDIIRHFDQEGRSFFELPACDAARSLSDALNTII